MLANTTIALGGALGNVTSNISKVALQTANAAARDASPGTTISASCLTVTLFLGIVMVVSLVGNTLVLVTFRMSNELNRVSDYFIINLSISDLTVTIISIPFWVSYVITGWPNNESGQIYTLWICLDIFCACWSIMSLAMISIERYFCIVYPMQYESIVTKQRGMTAVAFVLGYSTVTSILGYIQNTTHQAMLSVFIVVLSYVIPIIIKGFTYSNIYGEVRRQLKFMVQVEKDRERFLAFQDEAIQEDECDSDGSTPRQAKRTVIKNIAKKKTSFRGLGILQRLIGGKKQMSPGKKQQRCKRKCSDEVSSQLQKDGIEDWEEYVDELERRTNRISISSTIENKAEKIGFGNVTNAEVNSRGYNDSGGEGQRFQKAHEHPANEKHETEFTIISFSMPKPIVKLQWSKKQVKSSKSRKIFSRRFNKETKGAKVIGAIIGTFLLLWTPFIMIVVLSILKISVSMATIMAVKCLHYANSAINPILYIALNITLRKEVKKVLSKARNLSRRSLES